MDTDRLAVDRSTAFGTDFEAYAEADLGRLLRLARRLTASSDAAPDLAQETLVRVGLAWRRIDKDPAAYATTVLTALLPGASETGTVPPAGPSKTPTTTTTEPLEGRCGNQWVVISLGAYEGGGGLRQPVEVSNIGKQACSVGAPVPSVGSRDPTMGRSGAPYADQPSR